MHHIIYTDFITLTGISSEWNFHVDEIMCMLNIFLSRVLDRSYFSVSHISLHYTHNFSGLHINLVLFKVNNISLPFRRLQSNLAIVSLVHLVTHCNWHEKESFSPLGFKIEHFLRQSLFTGPHLKLWVEDKKRRACVLVPYYKVSLGLLFRVREQDTTIQNEWCRLLLATMIALTLHSTAPDQNTSETNDNDANFYGSFRSSGTTICSQKSVEFSL